MMGRTYFVDPSVEQRIESLADGKSWDIGLIIGQLSVERDFVIHLATSNSVLENDASLLKPESLELVNEASIVNHARQVKRMLTGGLDIIGIYALAETAELKGLQGKLRQILYGIQKAVSKPDIVAVCHSDRILLQIDSHTRNLVYRTFDVKDPKSSPCPCEWKSQTILDSFVTLSTTFSLDCLLPVSSEAMSFTLQRQMTLGLQHIYQDIWNSSAVINSSLVEDDTLPILPKAADHGRSRSKKPARDKETPANCENIVVHLLQDMSIKHSSELSPEELECGAKMLMRGTVSSQASVHAKSSAAEAVQAIKRDIIRSIVARCELLCDDLLQAEEEQDVRVVYETPQRVYAAVPNSTIKFCDYLFQDETLDDSADRFRILLELSITSDQVDLSAERLPEEADLTKPVRKLNLRKARIDPLPEKRKSSGVWKYLSLATAAAAAMFSYWIVTQEEAL